MTDAIILRNVTYLHKKSGRGVSELSDVFTPKIYGILGENGAGKTTLLKLLAGLNAPTSGTISFLGVPLLSQQLRSDYRNSVGYMGQSPHWPGDMKVKDFLDYFATLKGFRKRSKIQEIERVLNLVAGNELINRQLKTLSGGEHRRIFLAGALLGDPQILVLDEPTVALDPRQRIRFRDLVIRISKGKFVFWSTHIVDDLSHLASEVVVLNNGQKIWKGTVQELIATADMSLYKDLDISKLEAGFLTVLEDSSNA